MIRYEWTPRVVYEGDLVKYVGLNGEVLLEDSFLRFESHLDISNDWSQSLTLDLNSVDYGVEDVSKIEPLINGIAHHLLYLIGYGYGDSIEEVLQSFYVLKDCNWLIMDRAYLFRNLVLEGADLGPCEINCTELIEGSVKALVKSEHGIPFEWDLSWIEILSHGRFVL